MKVVDYNRLQADGWIQSTETRTCSIDGLYVIARDIAEADEIETWALIHGGHRSYLFRW